MVSMGIGLVTILLPCLVSGYLLNHSKLAVICWPEKPGSNTYFRILLVGWTWWLFWVLIALLTDSFLSDSSVLENWEKIGTVENKVLFFQEGVLATAMAIIARIFLDIFSAARLTNLKEKIIAQKRQDEHINFHLHILNPLQRSMEKFIWDSMKDSESGEPKMIMLTLKSRKIYIGFAMLMPTKDVPEWLELMPVASGFRNSQDKRMELTTSYFDLEENSGELFASRVLKQEEYKCLEDLKMILPVNEIVSFQRFHLNVYKQVQARRNAIVDGQSPPKQPSMFKTENKPDKNYSDGGDALA